MNWQELEQKQEQQWIDFEKLRIAAWDKLEQNRQAMYAAFGDKETEIPASVHEKAKTEREEWQAVWGEKGMREKYLRTIQQNERQALQKQIKQNVLEKLRHQREQKARSNNRERDD